MADPVVLIVDDNDDNRFTLSMRLESCGYSNLRTAEDGRGGATNARSAKIEFSPDAAALREEIRRLIIEELSQLVGR